MAALPDEAHDHDVVVNCCLNAVLTRQQYPAALVMVRLPREAVAAKHVYSTLLGVALCAFNFGSDALYCVASVFATWLVLRVFDAQRGVACAVVGAGNVAFLLGAYLLVSTDGYDIDWTLPQCVLCLRLIGLAWDCYDGAKPPAALRSDQLLNHIRVLPGLLETFSYAFFFTTVLTGPQFPLNRCARGRGGARLRSG